MDILSRNSDRRVPILMLVAFLMSCSGQNAVSQGEKHAPAGARKTVLSLANIENRLQILAMSQPPTGVLNTAPQDQPALPDRVTYVCPVCKSETIYRRPEAPRSARSKTTDRRSWSWHPATDASQSRLREETEDEEAEPPVWVLGDMVARQIPTCRKLAAEIRASGLSAKMDESRFCERCGPNPAVDKPYLTFTLHCAGEKEARRLTRVGSDDLRLMAEFLSGKRIHVAPDGVESPLKNYVKRLGFLLGAH